MLAVVRFLFTSYVYVFMCLSMSSIYCFLVSFYSSFVLMLNPIYMRVFEIKHGFLQMHINLYLIINLAPIQWYKQAHGYRLQSKFDQKLQINPKWSRYNVFHLSAANLHLQMIR